MKRKKSVAVTKTNEVRHTPGPWHYGESTSLHGTQLVYGPDGVLIADAGRIHRRSIEEEKANAALIAAAPKMLEALKETLATIKEYQAYSAEMRKIGKGFTPEGIDHTVCFAESVITQAEGKGE